MKSTMSATRIIFTAGIGFVLAGSSLVLGGKAAEVRVESFRELNKGVAAVNRGEAAVAVQHLQRAAGISLNSFRAHYYLGLALIGDRQYAAAVDALEIALDLDPNHLAAHVAQGDAFLKLGDLPEARAAGYRALKLRPAYARALDGLARTYEAQADDPRAIESYRQAILSDRGFAPAYTNLGNLYLRQDRVEEAVRLLEEAISIRPDYAPGLNRLALAYGRLGLSNQAVATVQKAIELEPGNASHLETLGRLQLEQDFLNSAETSFDNALQKDPNLAEAHLGLAEVARRRGESAVALEEIDIALDKPRVEASIRLKLDEMRASLERERIAAEALATRVAGEDATDEDRNKLASIYALRGLWDAAAEIQRGAGDSAESRERLAYMLSRAGRYREALGIYETLARETDKPDLLLNQGVSLALLGDDSAAIATYLRILEREPTHAQARLYLGNARLRLGRKQEAAQMYKSFLDVEDRGEAAVRVRRILRQIAPELLAGGDELPLPPTPPLPQEPDADEEG